MFMLYQQKSAVPKIWWCWCGKCEDKGKKNVFSKLNVVRKATFGRNGEE
jgi:hypothetical protein